MGSVGASVGVGYVGNSVGTVFSGASVKKVSTAEPVEISLFVKILMMEVQSKASSNI